MIKINRQYRLPSFDEVMGGEEPKQKLPSFDEVINSPTPKKKDEFPLLYKRSKSGSTPAVLPSRVQSKSEESKATVTPEFAKEFAEKIQRTEATDADVEKDVYDDISKTLQSYEGDDPLGGVLKASKSAQYLNPDGTTDDRANIKAFTRKLEMLENAFTSGKEARQLLQKDVFAQNIDNLPIEEVKKLAGNNITKQYAVRRYEKLRNVENALKDGRTFEESAIKHAATTDDNVKFLLEKSGGLLGGFSESTSAIPLAVRGEKVLQFLLNEDVQQLAEQNPDLKTQVKEEIYNFPLRHPEYATKMMAEVISRKRDEKGLNKYFANIVGKESTDKIVDELIEEGYFPANYRKIYEQNIRPKLGTFKSIGRGLGQTFGLGQIVNDAPIKTPGLLENIGEGWEKTYLGTAKTIANLPEIAGLPGIQDLVQPEAQQLYNVMKNQAETPQYEPEGLLAKTTMHGGQLGGFMLGLLGGTGALKATNIIKNPAVGSAAMMVLSTHADNADRAKTLFPRNDFKQFLYTTTMDGLNAAMGKFLPGHQLPKLLRGGETTVAGTLKKMVDGDITTDAAKNVIMNWFSNTAKGSLKGAEFMGAISAADDLLTQTLQGKGIDFTKSLEAGWEGFKIGLLATGPLAAFEGALKTNTGLRNEVMDIAKNPDYYKRILERELENDPELAQSKLDILENIDYVSNVYKEAQSTNVKNKEQYVINSLAEKIKLSKAENSTDPAIKKRLQKEAKDLNEIKTNELRGVPEEKTRLNQAIKEVKEFYDEGFLSKGSMEMIESAEGESGKPKFDEGKVKKYLEFVAQQSNNIVDGKFDTAFDSRKSAKQIPSQIRELANEMFPEYSKIAEDADYEIANKKTEPIELSTELPEGFETPKAEIETEVNIHPIKSEKDAIPEKSSLNFQKDIYGKQNTNKDEFQTGSQKESGIDRKTTADTEKEVSDRRIKTFIDWMDAIQRNDRKESQNKAQELLRESVSEKGQDIGLLANTDRGGEALRTSGGNGTKTGKKTSEIGTSSSQRSQQSEQPSGKPGASESIRSQSASSEGATSMDEGKISEITETEKRKVVTEIRKLSKLSDDGERIRSAGTLLSMLRENSSSKRRQNEIIDLIIKTLKDDAIQQQSTEKVGAHTSGDKSIGGGGESSGMGQGKQRTPPPGEKEKSKTEGEEEMIRLAHADTESIYKEHGLPERLETPTKKDAELVAEADRLVESGYDFDAEARKVLSGDKSSFTDAEQVAFAKMVGALEKKQEGLDINSPEFYALQKKIEDYSRASDIVGTFEGRSLRARQLFVGKDDTLADYVMREKEAAGVETLTEKQKDTVKKEFDDISEAEKSYQEKIAALEAENNRLKAEAEVKSLAKKPKSGNTKDKRASLIERLKQEAEDFKKSLHKVGAVADGGAEATIISAKMAKTVIEIAATHIQDGIEKLSEVISRTRESIKGVMPDIKEKEILDILAGKYSEKRPTRNQMAERLFDLRIEAKLINKLEALERGEEPKSEKKKVERNKQIKELRGKIRDFERKKSDAEAQRKADERAAEKAKKDALAEEEKFAKEFEKEKDSEAKKSAKAKVDAAKKLSEDLDKKTKSESALSSWKTKMQKQIQELEYKLKTGDFDAESRPQKELLKLDEEALELRDKLIKLKQKRDVRLLIQERDRESNSKRAIRMVAEIFNIPRTLMTIGDFSGLLRQNIFFSAGHPIITSKALPGMFKSFTSQNVYDRWFADLKETPRYNTLVESKLAIADTLSHDLTKREEAFMSSVAEKLPIVGSMKVKGVPVGLNIVKGSERSYTMLLNKMRVDMFNYFADKMEARGLTFENSPKEYKAMAEYINNATGRGSLGETLNKIAPLLNAAFFSPRLISSRLNMLTYWAQLRFWKTLPKEARIDYFRNWFSLLGVGLTILGLAKLGGAEVEDDPRSSDFGKIKSGDTRWDIWGGAQPYIRVIAQVATGKRKSTTTGKIYELDGEDIFGKTRGDVALSFLRAKLAPVPGAAVDFLSGRTGVGDKIIYEWEGAGNKEITIKDYIKERILPMTVTGTQEAIKDQGLKALLTVGIPSTFGVGTQTYDSKPSNRR